MNNDEIDNDIRTLLAANDPSALDAIWNAYSSDLLGYLIGILCLRHDAEDALQDVFVMIARKRCEVAKARKFKAYLFRLGRNVALNRIKRSQRRLVREERALTWLACDCDAESPDFDSGPVQAALEALPEKQRIVIALKFFRKKTFRDIGDMLGISENTAGSRYRYGMARLKKIMERSE